MDGFFNWPHNVGMNHPITVFLSHSAKDIEVVHKVRDILEALNFEPLIFRLHCLDDDSDSLEDFIKREIDARNVFIYCRSRNSEKSKWVQLELEYIRQKESNTYRYFEIDIEQGLYACVPQLLMDLSRFVRTNTVFLSATRLDQQLANSVEKCLRDNGYSVIWQSTLAQRKGGEFDLQKNLFLAFENGIFLPIISGNYFHSLTATNEFVLASEYMQHGTVSILELFVNVHRDLYLPRYPSLGEFPYVEVESLGDELDDKNQAKLLRAVNRASLLLAKK